ncbi:hypothetical protein [Bradyrhizobium valentinum]|uniref:Integrase n=1 Tax=Bradyrhizobium valentinum TaxID=1518501 RepID=A0A0R3M459_9BRAD|nr:hypothetical protein [Bradyrhizobium valentinum]KRR14737.1 hypothetical protein CP49_30955 [Bradyrhizobium valentinum]
MVRSGLSTLRVQHDIAEAIPAHRPPGIVGTYNLHEYEDEKAEALENWAQRLATIVYPVPAAPAKVVKLRGCGDDGPADRGLCVGEGWPGVL